ncbi:MAG: hypothetical protein V4726_24485 [Verrucomicrobiota bacterium]
MTRNHYLTLSAFVLLGAFAAWQAVQIRDLRAANAALGGQTKTLTIAERNAPPGPAGRASGSAAAKDSASPDNASAGQNPEDAARVARDARFSEMRTLERAQRIDARILALKTKLNLTPEQETAVRAAMDKGSADREALREAGDARRRNGGEETDKTRQADMAKFAALETAQEKAITDLMTEDQLAAYDQYKTEQKATQVESRANQQLNDLQGKLSLTDEQKDAAFQFYADQEQNGFDPGKIAAEGGDPRKYFEERQKQTLEAMRQILTAEQYELYSKQEEARSTLFRNGGGFGGFGGPRGGGGPPPGRP